MHINIIILILVTVVTIGCNSGRSGHRSINQQPVATRQGSVSQSFEHAMRAMLTARGYSEERPPGPLDEIQAYVWEKAGVRVFLQRDDAGQPAVLVGSFSKMSFQESEDMKLELLRLAAAYPGVRVGRMLTPQTVDLN